MNDEITIRKPFIRWLGGVEAAIVLDRFCRWQYVAGNEWWDKTDHDIRECLCITQHALTQARFKLEALGLLHKAKRGLPARLHYLVDTDAVRVGLSAFLRDETGKVEKT